MTLPRRTPLPLRRDPRTGGAGVLKRSAMPRSTGPERRGRLPSVSAKRARQQRAWTAIKALVHDRDGWRCRRCGWMDTTGATLDAHHLRLRSRGGRDEPENLVTLCAGPGTFDCHGWAHRNPEKATDAGFMLPSWDNGPEDAA